MPKSIDWHLDLLGNWGGPAEAFVPEEPNPQNIGVVWREGGNFVRQMYHGVDGRNRLALIQASNRKIGSLSDIVLLYCCNYVPSQGRYTVAVLRVLGLAGMASLAALVGLLFLLTRKPAGRTA